MNKRAKNLIGFANKVLLSSDRMGMYNASTGDTNPDSGYFIELLSEPRSTVDRDTIKEFWMSHYSILASESVWLGIWWSEDHWVYGLAELVEDLGAATRKAYERGAFYLIDNSNREYIELEPIGI
jgi:hypothetical protein